MILGNAASAVVEFDRKNSPETDASEEGALVRDGLELLAAFRAITDEEVRRSLVTLVGTLAKSCGD